MPPQPVSDISRLLATPFVDPKTGLITQSWREYVRYHIHTKVFGSMNLQGLLQPPASVLVPIAFGKNLVPNPGFEFNNAGTLFNQNFTTIGKPIGDTWQIFQNDNNSFFFQLSNVSANTGTNSLFIYMADNVSIAPGAKNLGAVGSSARLPLQIGDIIRVSGFMRQVGTALPAGVISQGLVGINIFNNAGTLIGNLFTFATPTGSFQQFQAALKLPATIAGQIPAYSQFACAMQITNNTAITFNSNLGNQYGATYFDDVRCVLQNTAFDLTPISTSYAILGSTSPVSSTTGGGINQATASIASFTAQFGDGQVNYNSGSISPLNDNVSYTIFGADPTYSGGAVAWNATLTGSSPGPANAANGNISPGSVTTPVHAQPPTTGVGGGNGPITIARIANRYTNL